MKIFISWSGQHSRAVASALKAWLSDVFQDVETWTSDHDISAGSRWSADLNTELECSNFGILCLTPDNLDAPWILFEAGSLAKLLKSARVVPYYVEVSATDISYPLAQFQGVSADELGTFKLLESINNVREIPLQQEKLQRLFEKWWPDFRQQLDDTPRSKIQSSHRSDRALLEETVQLLRGLVTRMDSLIENSSVIIDNSLIAWGKTKTIHDITEDDIAVMKLADLKRCYDKIEERWKQAEDINESMLLDKKMSAIRRRLDEHPNITKIEDTKTPEEPQSGA